MGRGIFLSYKYWDNSIYQFNKSEETIVSDYVDTIEGLFVNSRDCYCREGKDKQEISGLNSEFIERILSDKFFHTSITIVLISPEMIEDVSEKEQWIPQEISCSLRNRNRQDGDGYMNAILAVVLPDKKRRYDYAMYSYRRKTFVRKEAFFGILHKNMFNRIDCEYETDQHGNMKYTPKNSYVVLAKWSDFCINPDFYLNLALSNRSDWEQFEITDELN